MSSQNTGLFCPERPHHKKVMKILRSLPSVIAESGAVFAGGTFCSMMCGEYRRSDDVDFLCADPDGYRNLRQVLNEDSFGGIPVTKIKMDRYAIRCILRVDHTPIKFEIVAEENLAIESSRDQRFPVPVIRLSALAAAKLLANGDRWADVTTTSRDILDLGMLLHTYHLDTQEILERIQERDFRIVEEGLAGGLKMLANPRHFKTSAQKMEMKLSDMATARVAAKRFLAEFREITRPRESPSIWRPMP